MDRSKESVAEFVWGRRPGWSRLSLSRCTSLHDHVAAQLRCDQRVVGLLFFFPTMTILYAFTTKKKCQSFKIALISLLLLCIMTSGNFVQSVRSYFYCHRLRVSRLPPPPSSLDSSLQVGLQAFDTRLKLAETTTTRMSRFDIAFGEYSSVDRRYMNH